MEQRAHQYLRAPPKVAFLVAPTRTRPHRRRFSAPAPVAAAEPSGALFGQNPISLAGFDVKHPLRIAAKKVASGTASGPLST